MSARPRVLVTRPRARARALAERLEALGLEVSVCPLIETEPLSDDPLELSGYDWVVVTSREGAAELLRRRRGPLPRVAAIGPGTAAALADGGVPADLVPAVSTQEGLVEAFPRPPGRVAFVGAEGARRHLADALGADFVPLYRTVELHPAEVPQADLVVLSSASAARAFAALRRDVPAVTIGPQTSAAARRGGVRIAAEAATHDLDGLVAAVRSAACSSRS